MILTVTQENDAVRIDKYLCGECESLSRSYLQRLLKDGSVSVNGCGVKASYKVVVGDVISVDIPRQSEPDILPEEIPLHILYEDSDVIVVNKPKGMVVHPDQTYSSGTLVNALLYHCRDLSGINGVKRPGIVHRIDRDTTGSIIACKNDEAHKNIAAQLKEHTIRRVYVAIVHGVIKEEEGTIHTQIGRSPRDRKKMAVVTNGGKEAVTHFKVLRRFRNYTYVECRLETGRTHQIRVHMAHIHHPLVGDEVYCSLKPPVNGLIGQTLHAGIIGFMHPSTGVYIETEAPLPEYFQNLLETLPE